MNVIAILSHPQECGDDSLRLVSCDTGQVVLDINLTPEVACYEHVVTREFLDGEDAIDEFYDACVKQRYELNYQSDDFASCFSSYADRDCTKHLWSNMDWYWKMYEDDVLTIIDVEDTGVIPCRSKHEEELLGEKKVHSWRYTVSRVKLKYDDIYHKEWDSVYTEILDKCGIECLAKDRYDEQSMAAKIADAMGYKLLNVIYG